MISTVYVTFFWLILTNGKNWAPENTLRLAVAKISLAFSNLITPYALSISILM